MLAGLRRGRGGLLTRGAVISSFGQYRSGGQSMIYDAINQSTYVPRSTSAFWIIVIFADLITICGQTRIVKH